jgi:protein-tyrosine phosphatase
MEVLGYLELHFHLLPGVDDGPASYEESAFLAAAAAAEGTRTIVATPHVHPAYPTDPLEIPARVGDLSRRLRRERIRVDVLPGGELAHDMVERLGDRQLRAIAHGPPGRQWLLLEAPFAGLDAGFTAAAEELRTRGFAVVVAHPERSLVSLHAGWRVLEHELAAGSAIQLNAWSIAGVYGEQVRNHALRLLEVAPRVAVSSDAHGPERMPSLQFALTALREMGERAPHRLVSAVPRALLEHGLRAGAVLAA